MNLFNCKAAVLAKAQAVQLLIFLSWVAVGPLLKLHLSDSPNLSLYLLMGHSWASHFVGHLFLHPFLFLFLGEFLLLMSACVALAQGRNAVSS